jgi:hypothetical protein
MPHLLTPHDAFNSALIPRLLSLIVKEQLEILELHSGGASRDRTDDPLLAKQMLSQLSYGPSKLDIKSISSCNL